MAHDWYQVHREHCPHNDNPTPLPTHASLMDFCPLAFVIEHPFLPPTSQEASRAHQRETISSSNPQAMDTKNHWISSTWLASAHTISMAITHAIHDLCEHEEYAKYYERRLKLKQVLHENWWLAGRHTS